MNIYFLILIPISIFLIVEGSVYYRKKKKKKISPDAKIYIEEQIERIRSCSERDQILEFDKLLDFCLTEKGYDGNLGEKMKAYHLGFRDENAVWKAHRLRNQLAHEIDFLPRKESYVQATSAFLREIEAFVHE